jgi:hypothetical protein
MRYDKNPLYKCGTTGEREGEMPGRQKPVLDKKNETRTSTQK